MSKDPPCALTSAVRTYRGRLAPSPTGHLHLGHAKTFWTALERAKANAGVLILRNEDLDPDRSRPEFVSAMIEDLRWFGFTWQEGPDCGGPFGPYDQSRRIELHQAAFERLRNDGLIYPCTCSHKDVQRALQAPHAADDEPIYPGTCRHQADRGAGQVCDSSPTSQATAISLPQRLKPRVNWRFRVPDGRRITFVDAGCGPQTYVAGRDFGDFVVWRHDGVPSYQLAVVVDDAAMAITEVVRGADLLVSTARQMLLYEALHLPIPGFYHCALMADERGVRLAKRHDALSLRTLRNRGVTPEELRRGWPEVQ